MSNVLTDFEDALRFSRSAGADEEAHALRVLIKAGDALLATLQTPLRDIMALIESAKPAFPPVMLYDQADDPEDPRR